MILKIVIILSTAFIQLAINLNIAGECIFSEFIGSVPAKGINKWCESSQKKIFNMQKQIQTFKIQIFDLIRPQKVYQIAKPTICVYGTHFIRIPKCV